MPILITPSIRLNRTGFSMLVPRRAPSPLAPKTGAARNSPKPSTSAKRSVPAISFFERSSSSPSAMFVESVSAFIPSHSVSPRESAPRTIGNRKSLLRRVTERNGSALSSTSPEGARTAIPQKLGERISTPSIMACPPTLKRGPLLPVLAGLAAVLEALHPAAGVHYALLARVERVARAGDVQLHQRVLVAVLPSDRAARLYGRAAQDGEVRADVPENDRPVLGMYALLHNDFLLSVLEALQFNHEKGEGPLVRTFPKEPLAADALYLAQELGVGAGLLELLDQKLYLLRAVERVQDATHLPDPLGLGRLHEQLLLARRGVLDVDGGVDPAVRELALEVDLHVPRALELLVDYLVHPAPCLDERAGEDRERPAVLDVPRGPEEPL